MKIKIDINEEDAGNDLQMEISICTSPKDMILGLSILFSKYKMLKETFNEAIKFSELIISKEDLE
jgi:hypothetical protein